MRVFVAGATGVLGRRLVEHAVADGHDVVGLSRDDAGDAAVRDRGGEPHRGDLFDPGSLRTGAADADVVVHAATKIPTSTDPTDEEWAMNDRVRREGTENLVEAAGAVGAERFVQQSIVWVERQPDGSPFDETAPAHPSRSTQSALDAETIVDDGSDRHGFDPVVLRCGFFYAPDAAHTCLFGKRLLDRSLPIIGRGLLGRTDATLSFVHVDDAARAFCRVIDAEARGVYHVVDDEPVAYARFLRKLAELLEAPPPRRVPGWLTRFFVDEEVVRLLTRPMPTTNERFREDVDWTPQYPTYRDGLEQVVALWRETGTIRDRDGGYDWIGAGRE